MGSEIAVGNLKADSLQRDRQIVSVADKLFSGEGELVIDGSDIPDIIPILAVMACKRIGRTRFVNCGRLRLKESDRLTTVATLICALGGSAIVDKDDLIVDGCGKLVGGEIDSFKDHRIVMSAAIAATICTESVTITNAQDVAKSYPEFFEDYGKLGKKDKIEYCE